MAADAGSPGSAEGCADMATLAGNIDMRAVEKKPGAKMVK